MSANKDAAAIVAEVDAQRTDYITSLLIDLGHTKEDAERLGPVAYGAWLGEYSGAILRPRDDRIRNMRTLFELLVAQAR